MDESGEWTFTFQLARSMCLLTAAAIGVQAIDTVHAVAPINAAFTPTATEIEHARRLLALAAR